MTVLSFPSRRTRRDESRLAIQRFVAFLERELEILPVGHPTARRYAVELARLRNALGDA